MHNRIFSLYLFLYHKVANESLDGNKTTVLSIDTKDVIDTLLAVSRDSKSRGAQGRICGVTRARQIIM